MPLFKYLIVSTILMTGILFSFNLKAQSCGTDAFLDKCAPSLGDYTFIKSFMVDVDKEGEKKEVSYVFSKGSTYRIVICDEEVKGKEMKVKLFDRNKKTIASNYLSSSRKYFPVLNYTCTATGVYYVESSFKSGKKGCGVIILGFTK